MRTQTLVAILGLVVVVSIAGCSGIVGSGEDVGEGSQATDVAESETAGDSASMADEGDGSDGQQVETFGSAAGRDLVHTAEIELRVDDVETTSEQIRRMVSSQGGFVSASNQQLHRAGNATWRTGTIVVRVPSESFQGSIAELEGVGEVREFSSDTEDVTDQLVDLEARLNNLEAERDRLRTLFEEAEDTQAILNVQRDLSSVQQEIERLRAQQKRLEDRVALSTITLRLSEPQPDQNPADPEPEWYETGLVTAFSESLDGLVLGVRALAVATAYAAPYALILGSVVGGLGTYWSRRSDEEQSGDESDRTTSSDTDGDPDQ